mmetsp:Transcript_18852/g.58010  ORF Transcript_18852/g.58010 Transcript_18852/m.58010 type:complete len:227 (-) Transcript_18852:9-689(-)
MIPRVARCDGRKEAVEGGVEVVGVEFGEALVQRREAGFADEGGEVGPGEAVGACVDCQGVQVDVAVEADLAGRERAQNGSPVVTGRQRHEEELVDAAGPRERRVEQLRSIRGGHDVDLPPRVEAVQLGQQLVHDAVRHRVIRVLARRTSRTDTPTAARAEGVDFVEEDDARRRGAGAREERADLALALAHELVQELGTFDRDEVGAGLGRDGFREERLAAARRAVQ